MADKGEIRLKKANSVIQESHSPKGRRQEVRGCGEGRKGVGGDGQVCVRTPPLSRFSGPVRPRGEGRKHRDDLPRATFGALERRRALRRPQHARKAPLACSRWGDVCVSASRSCARRAGSLRAMRWEQNHETSAEVAAPAAK